MKDVNCVFDNLTIDIHTRDINGKKSTFRYLSESDLLAKIRNDISEEDEILIVLWGSHVIYSSLTNCEITIDDLTGFFG